MTHLVADGKGRQVAALAYRLVEEFSQLSRATKQDFSQFMTFLVKMHLLKPA